MAYLVDTSAWIRHFAGGDDFDLRSVCEPDDRVLCLPIYQEILQGIGNESTYRAVKTALDAGVFVEDPLTREVVLQATELYRLARKRGLTIRSSVDCIIAACAVRHNLVVVHADRDFSQLAKVSALRELPV